MADSSLLMTVYFDDRSIWLTVRFQLFIFDFLYFHKKIDSSRSISPEEYEIEKDAVKVLVREFWPVNRENTQIALLQYGSVVQVIHR